MSSSSVGTEYVGGSGGKNAKSATTLPTSHRFEQRMPASAVEIRQLFAQPWSSDAGLGRGSWMGVNVVCAKVASPSSGCAAMGASAAIVSLLLFWWRVDGVAWMCAVGFRGAGGVSAAITRRAAVDRWWVHSFVA